MEMEYRIGCSGWSYSGWLRNFYPAGTKAGDYLKLYSRVFDTVEIDSTFYRIPSVSMVDGWNKVTPAGFRFTAKMPKLITHEEKLLNSGSHLDDFMDVMKGLGEKLAFLVIQLPPSFRREEGYDRLKSFISVLPSYFSYAVEFRHGSWFTDDVYSMLSDSGITLAWSELHGLAPHMDLTSDSVYLRLVGDRSIPEEKFGTAQKDRTAVAGKWADEIARRKDEVRHAFVFANNHFQGFGPFTVNLFRQSAGMEPVDWGLKMRSIVPDRQKTLF